MAVINGTAGNDVLIGTDLDDTISGFGGDDFIQGLGGADVINGGAGVDTVDYREKATPIAVTLTGGTAATVFINGVAEDTIANIENVYGGSGDDFITGDAQNNLFRGGGGNDVLDGGAGNDTADYTDKTTSVVVTLAGATPVTVFVNGIAEDTISNFENVYGGSGNDILTGDGRDNILRGEGGDDILNGGGGDDSLSGWDGNDTVDGGNGIDTFDLREKTSSVVVQLNGANAATVFVGGVAEDTIRNVENIVGGSADDTLIGDAAANKLSGARGNDWLVGGAGADILDGGEDSDTADYSDKQAAIVAALNGSNPVTVTVGGLAEDSIAKIENIVGGSGDDTITGDAAANTFRGGLGADVLDGGAGSDTVDFSDKAQSIVLTLNGAVNAVAAVGGAAEDTVRNIENIIGGSGNDQFTGDAAANTFRGGLGADVLDGGAGSDTADYSDRTSSLVVTLAGASPATVFVGGVAEDTLRNIENITGGSGNDVFVGDGLQNVFDGGQGTDTVDYSGSAKGIGVTLNGANDAKVFVGNAAEDTLRNVENIIGSAFADVITGDSLANVLLGGGGGDILKGGAGQDAIDGGSGSDTIDFGDKTAAVVLTLAGVANTTATVGGVAEDTVRNIENIFGGAGADVLTGDGNSNTIRGSAGADGLDGGAGVDTADYRDKVTSVVVTLSGANAAVVKVGGLNEDTIRNFENVAGGSAGDTLIGDDLANVLLGNDGADTLKGGLGSDVLDGGNGIDTADYLEKADAISVTLNGTTNATVLVGGVAEDVIRGVENILAGSGADTLVGDGASNTFRGALGADFIDGGAGSDTADYREKAAAVDVTLFGAGDSFVFVGGVAEDTIRNVENVFGGKGNDTLTGDDFVNTLNGNDGKDLLTGGGGADILDGGAASDTANYRDKSASVSVTLNGAASTAVIVGGVAEDTVRNIENVWGGTGNDSLSGDGNANLLSGGGGSDILSGGAGADIFQFDFALGASNVDMVLDFTAGDRLFLSKSVFTTLSGGSLASNQFYAAAGATEAQGSNQRVVYDTTTGALYYDADGNLSGHTAVQFAVLSTQPGLTAGDFVLVV
ncbi:hemolysin type calcium-binding protein [Sinorhizobium medicae]|uniref:calcium-binding protein n=1 Tax=Sinorhizobium medicae TaxID=110321 RepID=UPI0011A4DB65|nr:calcium-binding protein [Sinorhizobium medicae]MDX0692912.1 calcium-binding protein [Sinorhizobium medicae]MDX0744327.1 calcium-binding protein [Sinorhizobium medicae]MDX0767696.1 calcium-binding protein [Sinorhizobium medicae]MDX1199949.1 calcium-binding protein [Sinorhizobium medicae]TWA56578.1 hemolysin type calcium-binding protein [Sinorhizobium medicae]